MGDLAARISALWRNLFDTLVRDNKVLPPVLALLALLLFAWVVAGAFLGGPEDEEASSGRAELVQSTDPDAAAGTDAPEVETFVVQVEDIAETAGVTQTQIVRGAPVPPEGGGDFTVQPITMSFEGTYEELLEFLRLADDLVRLLTVNDVAYEVAEEGTTAAPEVEQNLTVEIDAVVYYQPTDVPEGTAPAAPVPPETSPETTTAAPAAE